MSRTSKDELARRAQIYQAAMAARSPPWGPVEIAEKAGLADHSQVSLIVRGRVSGSVPRIRAIAKVLGIPLDNLLDAPTATSDETSTDEASAST